MFVAEDTRVTIASSKEIRMSKRMIAVWTLIVCVATMSYGNEIYTVYHYGSGAANVSAPPGMRFGDPGHVTGMADGGFGSCQSCFGVQAPVCDPCWGGPCMDWKLIGWYSHFPSHCHKGRGRCCAVPGEQDDGASVARCESCP